MVRGDYAQQRRDDFKIEQLRRAECRAVAWLVCRSLGDAWRLEVGADDYRRDLRLVHRATCATLSFRNAWRDENRYEIVPENVHRTDSMPKSISVSGERSPASIAADIERRIIAAGLFDQNAAHLSAGHARRADETRRRRRCLAVAGAYGGGLKAERGWKHTNYPEANAVQFGRLDADSEWKRETSIAAATDYYEGVDLTISTTDIKLAIQIGELVRDYYNLKQG